MPSVKNTPPARVRKGVRVPFNCIGPTRTKQSFGPECDINNIMAKFAQTGLIDHVNEFQGRYEDFTDVPTDYHAAVNQVFEAEAMFMTIPAKLRARFNNDPGEFLAFVEDPNNTDELVELGLATRRPVQLDLEDAIAAAPDPNTVKGEPAGGGS